MKLSLLASSLMLSTTVFAAPNIPLDQQLGSMSITEVSSVAYSNNPYNNNPRYKGIIGDEGPNLPMPNGNQNPGPIIPHTRGHYNNYNGDDDNFNSGVDKAGRVIQAAKDMVALGEAIYDLVKKGKPTNVTEYAPISVVPRDPTTKEYVDPFDLEGFSMPVEKSYIAKITDKSGREAVRFNYKVIYSYGGSYNGTGKYLSNVIIIPGSVTTHYGWDFNATMKLSGIMNHGTKANPVAGVMVTVKYQMNSWSAAYERNDTIYISGNGELKSFAGN